ncbi:FtsX-like permease family protein [Sanguibacter massiliensis]|uniref:FtsX-like permease family protein n=1 Tax=Sanguibacter massiliensis TaxID=1973217 RepID=UPI000C86374F|nr:FtsX-like permease family protein [Sanguibacter massiliensis]
MSVAQRVRPAPRAAASRHAVGRRGGRLARLRALARVARRDVRSSPGRTALVAGLTLLPAAVATLLTLSTVAVARPPVVDDLVPSGVEAVLTWHVRPVTQDGPLALDVATTLDEPPAPDKLRAEAGLAALTRTVDPAQVVTLRGCAWTDRADGSLRGFDTCELASDPTGRAAPTLGRMPVTRGEIAAGDIGLGLGDVVTVRAITATGAGYVDVDLTVVGLLDPAIVGARVLVSEPVVAPLTGSDGMVVPDGTYLVVGQPLAWSDLVALNQAGLSGPSRDAAANRPAASEVPYLVAGYGEPAGTRTSEAVGTVALVAVGVGLVLVLTIAPAHVVGVRRRARELALLAVTGATPRDLRHLVMLGAALQGIVAALAGTGAGIAATFVGEAVAPGWAGGVDMTDLRYAVPYLAGVGGVVVATVALAAWAPGRTAGRLDPVAVLGGRRAEPRPPARLDILGGVLAVVGLGAVAWAARTGSDLPFAAGTLGLALGAVLLAGPAVTLLGRLARGAALPVRLAPRDAARDRTRTAAGVTAVMVTSAALVAGIVIGTSFDARERAAHHHAAGEGRVVVDLLANGTHRPPLAPGNDAEADARRLHATVRETDPGARIVVVRGPGTDVTHLGPEEREEMAAQGLTPIVVARTAPDEACPIVADPFDPTSSSDTDALRRAQREDPRCDPRVAERHSAPGWSGMTLVDDGTALSALGMPGTDDGVAALRAGLVLDSRDAVVTAAGTTTLEVHDAFGNVGEATTLPATYVPELAVAGRLTILPPAVADRLGLHVEPVGLVVEPSSDAARSAVAATLREELSSFYVTVEDWTTTTYGPYVRGLAAAGLVLGIGTALLVLLLLAGESRPDLAVLSAIGAAPGLRRRLAGAQAVGVVGTGVALGTLVGLVVSVAVVLARVDRDVLYDPTWQVVIPWGWLAVLVVGLVGGAWLTGWSTTRSRMPLPSEVR